jgi:GAF domain-containing protein
VPSDRRLAGNPLLELLHLESYAGFPLRDAGGAVIGALCVASLRPRSSFTAAAPALEQYAHAAEAEILRLRAGSTDDRRRSARG